MAQAALVFDGGFDTAPAPLVAAPGTAARRAAAPQAPRGDDDATAFELGRDHARCGVLPPPEHLLPGHPLRQGWDAGRAVFGAPRPVPGRHTRQWLALRLHAWCRGRSFETLQVTPAYLAQIDSARCPVSRQALAEGGDAARQPSVDRVFDGAGYAAGNLAVLSARVNAAKGDLRWDEARLLAAAAEARPDGCAEGLHADEWERLAVLMSFVTPLPHAVAASLPLRVLPPNRLRLLNPVQGLQTLVTRLLLSPGYVERSERVAALLPAGEARRDFRLVFLSLLPRAWDSARSDATARRERLEDAWRCPVLLRRWQRFARHIDAAGAEALVEQAMRAGLGGSDARLQLHSEALATEGWALETAGYVAAAQRPAQPRTRLARRVRGAGTEAAQA